MDAEKLELIGIRLRLLDLVAPYEITVKQLLPFSDECLAILQIPLQEREKALYELVNKIRKYYKVG